MLCTNIVVLTDNFKATFHLSKLIKAWTQLYSQVEQELLIRVGSSNSPMHPILVELTLFKVTTLGMFLAYFGLDAQLMHKEACINFFSLKNTPKNISHYILSIIYYL